MIGWHYPAALLSLSCKEQQSNSLARGRKLMVVLLWPEGRVINIGEDHQCHFVYHHDHTMPDIINCIPSTKYIIETLTKISREGKNWRLEGSKQCHEKGEDKSWSLIIYVIILQARSELKWIWYMMLWRSKLLMLMPTFDMTVTVMYSHYSLFVWTSRNKHWKDISCANVGLQ